ncbi:DUF4913 domain-containing protein [Arthrobacter halodurans]|uniref:DUF4913 domain-containing protein n=1 Tax=Arthrobacter halodurans TaxID=516699 RepID=A0ABV4UKX0_9MICC
MDGLDLMGQMDAPPPIRADAGSKTTDDAGRRLEAAHQALAAAEGAVRDAEAKIAEGMSGWIRAAAESLAQAERTRDRAVAEVEKAAGEVAAAREPGGAPEASPESGAAATDESPLVYASAEEFLHEQLLPLYNRILDSRNGKWCRQWFLHPEAVSRVEAVWRAWEHLRLDAATGMSVWWRDHADPHMSVLLSQKGPFYGCSADRHNTPEPFPCDYAPEGWFPQDGEIQPK